MAEQSGAALGASLYKLTEAAAYLDNMAGVFLEANGQIAGTGDGTDGSFHEHETPAGGSSPVETYWVALRDQMQGLMGQNYTHLTEAAVALRTTVAGYAGQDQAAADHLKSSIDENNASPDEDLGTYEYPTTDETPSGEDPDIPDDFNNKEES